MLILPVENRVMNSMTYILYERNVDYCILIDCGDYDTLAPVLDSIGKTVDIVLLTHGHSDHIYGLIKLLKENPAIKIGTTECGHIEIGNSRKNLSLYHNTPFEIKKYNQLILFDNQILHFEGIADIKVTATPGHDDSCLCYCTGKYLFTGDSYIPGINVFYNFPRGNKKLAIENRKKLLEMEKDGFCIYCGHHSYSNIVKS